MLRSAVQVRPSPPILLPPLFRVATKVAHARQVAKTRIPNMVRTGARARKAMQGISTEFWRTIAQDAAVRFQVLRDYAAHVFGNPEQGERWLHRGNRAI